ncbi:hypothetical protein ES288_A11G288600v1 [Gossypium darwinii]|uniref:Uncharacterized protein n=2 Tax=Gossypium TaxID=3633 RepID=A0A5D2NF25_GOSTO|nr:hypothetical protein ES288_A11G288600v1 [Gossypium darwinii]TYI02691.1 hypothetical protein ES332_A11G285100v1 [Gossypium tomentosum]
MYGHQCHCHLLEVMLQYRKIWLTDSSCSPHSGHRATYLSLRAFKLLNVGKKLLLVPDMLSVHFPAGLIPL